MSVTLESFALTNRNPSSSLFSKRASTALCSPTPLRFESLLRRHRVSIVSRAACPTEFGLGLLPLRSHGFRNRSVFAFAASHEESKPTEIEMEKEKSDLKKGAEESEEAWKQALASLKEQALKMQSEEAWKQTLASFKEQALKMQGVSQEAYELYSKKATIILQETSVQLKIQAEKARHDLSVIAKEIGKEGKEYLLTAAEKSPEPVKDIVDTFATSTDDVKEISEVLDFYLGIPYGILLSIGGFLSFMLTGSISAIRFGVILGGTLLALSIASLSAWKKGEPFPLALKGQAAIASILFLREIRLLFVRPSFTSCFTALFSGAMVAFYLYRITMNGGQTNASNLEQGTDN
ncbi:protein FATTY ACID EXPORT 3, chloroplastic-like isoform X1 [Actinidia eriantha]|uniref:protein FATTY ACID EXPORT 3, chloroplastic-like isoform X1 n=1 Tax=Actinidia eriantha TaxID=165200 RepID=UPI002587B9B3|nr:protein FATTY ACID EXPORT 3, chloroplastic-like isoform X1 [Actinidia eriantha]